jgi:hypothetical protein
MAQGRKILYIIGAGASRAVGAYVSMQGGGRLPIPTQSEFWDAFLRLAGASAERKDIESFLFRYFLGYSRVPARASAAHRRQMLRPIDVEEVFTFLSERSKAPSSSSQLKQYVDSVWLALVGQIGRVFSRFQPNTHSRRIVRRFHGRHVKSRDAIVSFNYDTVFEGSLPRNVPWAYAGIEDTAGKLHILKPHGSINWERRSDLIRRVSDAVTPIIVAPTHLKFIQSSGSSLRTSGYLDDATEIRMVWEEMEREMRAARILVFIGYSFPEADLYFSSVLRTALSGRDSPPAIVIVNPDAVSIAQRLSARFPLKQVVRYFALDQFIDAGRAGVQRAIASDDHT